MTRHSRLRSQVCPIGVAAVLAFLFSPAAVPAQPAPATLSAVQQVAAARGGEALDSTAAVSRAFFKEFDPAALSLLIVQPGRWVVLLNHPKPPAGFSEAAPLPRRKIAEEDPDMPPWSVHFSSDSRPFENLPHPWIRLDGRPTAVAVFNSVSVATGNAAGWPPSEAVVIHLVRALWQAHRASVEPPRPIDTLPWLYQADAGTSRWRRSSSGCCGR